MALKTLSVECGSSHDIKVSHNFVRFVFFVVKINEAAVIENVFKAVVDVLLFRELNFVSNRFEWVSLGL